MANRIKKFLKSTVLFLLTMIFISVLTFALIKMQPGDPAKNYLRLMHIGVNEESVKYVNTVMGFDKPVAVQYLDWLEGALRGDLGTSYFHKKPVVEVVFKALVPSMELGAFALVIETIMAFLLGILAALNHYRLLDRLVMGFSFICVSIPTFWLGYLLIILFALKLDLLPVLGRGSIEYYILPATTMMLPVLGKTTLFIRNVMLEQMSGAHVRNAILRGVNKKYVVKNHVLRNSSGALITVFGQDVSYMLTGTVLIEEIFAWPGLGRMFAQAVRMGDLPLIQGSLLLFGIMAVIINALTQKAVFCVNPLLRLGQKE